MASETITSRNHAGIPYDGRAHEWLECLRCHARFQVAPMFFGCPTCNSDEGASPVEMRYAPRPVVPPSSRTEGLWGWRSHLPAIPRIDQVTLGEGATHLLPLQLASGGPRVFLKNETSNPTWSWKDRPNAVSVSVAKHFGYRNVVAISTGNHGNAMAALAASAGLHATVFCNAAAPALQLAMMKEYGARVVRGGDSEAMVLDLLKSGLYFPCTVLSSRAGYSNPFGVEGFKTIAFELWQQLGTIPDRVFVGVGSGDGVYGIWKGFRELRDSGTTDRVPRIFGCQTMGANSLVRAYRERAATITPLSAVHTVASSLAELAVGQQALDAVYHSEGAAIEVSDEEALTTMHWLARRGIALEPSSAVPLACLQKTLQAEGEASTAGELWVSMGSGAAPKWPDDLLRDFIMPEALPDGTAISPVDGKRDTR